jgi:hypothetical protein
MSGAVEKCGLTIQRACTYSGIGKTSSTRPSTPGKLKAARLANDTVILSDDLRDYLSSLPLLKERRSRRP